MSDAAPGGQIAWVIDLNKCIGCQTCSVACKVLWTREESERAQWWCSVNTLPGRGYPRGWQSMGAGDWPNSYYFYLPRLCNHCSRPACAEACPSSALKKNEDGLVLRDESVCQGSDVCMEACPQKKSTSTPSATSPRNASATIRVSR
ncbi:MAG: hypothetical protein QGH42_00885 [Kiritimatiellia bacterium]|jgi:nitrate reductase beta subunit|nr:hypothetical protein [Pseudomonadales bacterium]MDP6472598.1 hypothetical protein [Pseudomonadales bacterium]MDP6829269.1 hypothetical protein [Pseudomonadales bacterium]MDP7022793.1 hypothetical protein [Kiritimatiellia bacterium]|tara:strand:+ start:464 stop:904 length:441 start_codon:yes stop_codon:yes gene_type:complete